MTLLEHMERGALTLPAVVALEAARRRGAECHWHDAPDYLSDHPRDDRRWILVVERVCPEDYGRLRDAGFREYEGLRTVVWWRKPRPEHTR